MKNKNPNDLVIIEICRENIRLGAEISRLQEINEILLKACQHCLGQLLQLPITGSKSEHMLIEAIKKAGGK